jgi:hypothetical protein
MDVKSAIRQLFQIYSKKLKGGFTCDVIDPSADVTANSLALAEQAFKQPPRFFLDRNDAFPTHCFDKDIFTVATLDAVLQTHDRVAVTSYIEQRSTPEALAVMFSDHLENADFTLSQAARLSELLFKFHEFDNIGLGRRIADALPRAIDVLRQPPLYFGEQRSTAWWVGRLCTLTLILIPACDAESQRVVLELLVKHMAHEAVCEWIGRLDATTLRAVVAELQSTFAILMSSPASEKHLFVTAAIITMIHRANTFVNSRGIISYKDFYNPTAVELQTDDIIRDFERSLSNQQAPAGAQRFTFSRFPCLVDTKFKSTLMQCEAIIQTRHHMQQAAVRQLFLGPRGTEDPFLTLNIRRDRLVQSALWEVQRKADHLKKPLRVQFLGEEGIDAGGVRKEFFQLLMKELLDPNYGMFYQTESRDLWIQPRMRCQVGGDEFQLVGTLLGLAVYNNVILDVSFPQALYRKLLGRPMDFADLEEVEPSLASGLRSMLEFEDAPEATVEDVFCVNFVYEYEVFDERRTEELCPGGKDRVVTAANRSEYVKLLTHLILDTSLATQFERFNQGFRALADRDLMQTLHAEELELLVCGQQTFDFNDLEESTKYEGYEKNDDSVRILWKVLHSLNNDDKRLFLKFTTGSDRVPIGGLKDLNFVVGKNGDDQDMLPTAHTCFNHLLLPSYRDETTCAAKIKLAIQNCHGFGLR